MTVGVIIALCAWGWATVYFLYVRCRVSAWGVTLTTYLPPKARVRVWPLAAVERFHIEHRRRSRLDSKGLYRLELCLSTGVRHLVLESKDERVTVWLAANLQRGLERARDARAS